MTSKTELPWQRFIPLMQTFPESCFVTLNFSTGRQSVEEERNIVFMGIFFDHSRTNLNGPLQITAKYMKSRHADSNYSKCMRSVSMSIITAKV